MILINIIMIIIFIENYQSDHINNFIVHYGIPERIHSDQGTNFENQVIKELFQLTWMMKSRTTSYHPMGNGMCERFNRTLLNMLGSLEQHQKQNWKGYVSSVVHLTIAPETSPQDRHHSC